MFTRFFDFLRKPFSRPSSHKKKAASVPPALEKPTGDNLFKIFKQNCTIPSWKPDSKATKRLLNILKQNSPLYWNSLKKGELTLDKVEHDVKRLTSIQQAISNWITERNSLSQRVESIKQFQQVIISQLDTLQKQKEVKQISLNSQKSSFAAVSLPVVSPKFNSRDELQKAAKKGKYLYRQKSIIAGTPSTYFNSLKEELPIDQLKKMDERILKLALNLQQINSLIKDNSSISDTDYENIENYRHFLWLEQASLLRKSENICAMQLKCIWSNPLSTKNGKLNYLNAQQKLAEEQQFAARQKNLLQVTIFTPFLSSLLSYLPDLADICSMFC